MTGLVVFPLVSLLILKRNGHPALRSSLKNGVSPGWLILANSFILNPRRGALFVLFDKLSPNKKNWFRFSTSLWRIVCLSIILFTGIGILSLSNHQFQFSGIPNVVVQQITPLTKLTFSAEPAGFAETGTIVFIFMLMMGILSLLINIFIKDEDTALITYYLVGFILCLVNGAFWYLFHNIAYGNNAVAHFSNFFFGFIGTLFTLLFGNMFIFWIWHWINNFFAKLVELFPRNNDVLFFSISFLVLFTLFYLSMEYFAFQYRKKHRQEVF
jgi:hypothetical protein